MTNQNNNSVAITENVFNTLSNFFGGSFHFGIHSNETISASGKQYPEWCRTVAYLVDGKENQFRNAEFSDISFCRLKNREGKDIFVRPAFDVEKYFILLDDLNPGQANRYARKPGTLVVCSSPGKMQVWQHSDRALSEEEKKAMIVLAGADQGAHPRNRWGRCPGYANYKKKYEHLNYPYSTIVSVTDGLATLPIVEGIETPVKSIETPIRVNRPIQVFGNGTVNINRLQYVVADESTTDFRYTLALLRRGVDDGEIVSRILNERQDWSHKSTRETERERYVRNTITKARNIM